MKLWAGWIAICLLSLFATVGITQELPPIPIPPPTELPPPPPPPPPPPTLPPPGAFMPGNSCGDVSIYDCGRCNGTVHFDLCGLVRSAVPTLWFNLSRSRTI